MPKNAAKSTAELASQLNGYIWKVPRTPSTRASSGSLGFLVGVGVFVGNGVEVGVEVGSGWKGVAVAVSVRVGVNSVAQECVVLVMLGEAIPGNAATG